MARQVLKEADLPPEVLIQSEGDTRYLQQSQADARYPLRSDTDPYPQYNNQARADARYLQLTGGAVSGALTVGGKAVAASPDGGNALEFRSNGFYAGGGGGGSFSSIRDEEFAPAAAATSVVLAATPVNIVMVSRNGVVQSQAAGNYSLAGSTITFTDAFVAGERVAVVYEIGVAAGDLAYTKNDSDIRYVNVAGDTMTGVLQVNANVGVGVAPGVWPAAFAVLRVGRIGALWGDAVGQPGTSLRYSINTKNDGSGQKSIEAGTATMVDVHSGGFDVYTAVNVAAADTAQAFVRRFNVDQNGNAGTFSIGAAAILGIRCTQDDNTAYQSIIFGRGLTTNANMWRIGQNISSTNENGFELWDEAVGMVFKSVRGTRVLTLNAPAAGSGTVNLTSLDPEFKIRAGNHLHLTGGAAITLQINDADHITHYPGGGQGFGPVPALDASASMDLGGAGRRWRTVFAQTGAINTSVYEAKEDFKPLDPALCATAVAETDWVSFAFRTAPYVDLGNPEGEAPEDKEARVDKERVAYAKYVSDTAHVTHQKGYVLQSPVHKVHDLFGLDDRQSASPGSDLAVVACALQAALQRITALEQYLGVQP